MSGTPSSRRSRRSVGASQASTPVRAPTASSTARQTQQQNGNVALSSSPMFYRSSPAQQTPRPSQRSNGEMLISSPPRQPSSVGDREATPRPPTGQNAIGMSNPKNDNRMMLTSSKSRLLSATIPVRVLRRQDREYSTTSRQAAVVVFLFEIEILTKSEREEGTYIQITSSLLQHVNDGSLSTNMVCPLEMASQHRIRPSRMLRQALPMQTYSVDNRQESFGVRTYPSKILSRLSRTSSSISARNTDCGRTTHRRQRY